MILLSFVGRFKWTTKEIEELHEVDVALANEDSASTQGLEYH